MGETNHHLITLSKGQFDASYGTSKESVRALFDRIGTTRPNHLLVHFHGGLIDRASGVAAAEELKLLYELAGAYPLFFIWELGWHEVVHRNIPDIFKENVFKRILTRVTQMAKAKADQPAVSGTSKGIDDLELPKDSQVREELDRPADKREPFSDVDPLNVAPLTEQERKALEERIKNDPQLALWGQEIANSLATENVEAVPKGTITTGTTETLMDPDVVKEITAHGDEAKGEPKAIFTTVMLAIKCGQVLT